MDKNDHSASLHREAHQLQEGAVDAWCDPEWKVVTLGQFLNDGDHEVQRWEGIDEAIAIWVLEGQGYVQPLPKGKRNRVKKGEMVLIPRGQPHQYGSDSQRPWSIFWMHLQGDRVDAMVEKELQGRAAWVQDWTLEASKVLRWLEIARAHGSRARLSVEVLAGLMPRWETNPREQPSEVIRFMMENLHRSLEVRDLAALEGVSEAHFSRRFRARHGAPPLRYFTKLRVMEASRRLVRAPHRRVSEIALEMGFDDALHFSRLFRHHLGHSPREHRRSMG